MAGSSPGDSCLPAAASTAPTALLGSAVGEAVRAKEKVQTGLFYGEWTGCHSKLPTSSGQEGLAPVCVKL